MKSRFEIANTVTELTAQQQQWRDKFIIQLKRAHEAREGLRKPVQKLLESGVPTSSLVEWGMEAGYSAQWLRQIISTVFINAGKRRNAKGQGRRYPQAAIDIAQKAIRRFHEEAPRLLLSAYRYAKGHTTRKQGSKIEKRRTTQPTTINGRQSRFALAA